MNFLEALSMKACLEQNKPTTQTLSTLEERVINNWKTSDFNTNLSFQIINDIYTNYLIDRFPAQRVFYNLIAKYDFQYSSRKFTELLRELGISVHHGSKKRQKLNSWVYDDFLLVMQHHFNYKLPKPTLTLEKFNQQYKTANWNKELVDKVLLCQNQINNVQKMIKDFIKNEKHLQEKLVSYLYDVELSFPTQETMSDSTQLPVSKQMKTIMKSFSTVFTTRPKTKRDSVKKNIASSKLLSMFSEIVRGKYGLPRNEKVLSFQYRNNLMEVYSELASLIPDKYLIPNDDKYSLIRKKLIYIISKDGASYLEKAMSKLLDKYVAQNNVDLFK